MCAVCCLGASRLTLTDRRVSDMVYSDSDLVIYSQRQDSLPTHRDRTLPSPQTGTHGDRTLCLLTERYSQDSTRYLLTERYSQRQDSSSSCSRWFRAFSSSTICFAAALSACSSAMSLSKLCNSFSRASCITGFLHDHDGRRKHGHTICDGVPRILSHAARQTPDMGCLPCYRTRMWWHLASSCAFVKLCVRQLCVCV